MQTDEAETTNVITMDGRPLQSDDVDHLQDNATAPSSVDAALDPNRRKDFEEPVVDLDEEVIAQASEKVGKLITAAKPQRLELAEVTIEEWLVLGEYLLQVEAGIQWWVGDWLVYGRDLFPDQYFQGLNPYTMDPDKTRNWEYVSSRYPELEDRFEKLSWTHHYIAAKADTIDVRKELLNFAVANSMATRAFRQYVDRALTGAIEEAEPDEDNPATHIKYSIEVTMPIGQSELGYELVEKGRHAWQRVINQTVQDPAPMVKLVTPKEVRDAGAAAA